MGADNTSRQTIVPQAIELSEASFRMLVDSVRDYAIYMLDPDGNVLSWNPGAERIKGYRADEIIGRNFRQFYAPEDIAAGRPEHELAVASATGRYEEEWWRLRKDGSRFRAHVVVTALRDPHGTLVGFAKVTQDVTDRYEAEQALRESEERFRILVEQIREYAIFLLDPNGRIATWNRGAERIKGYTADEVLGRPLTIFYTPEDVAQDRLGRLLEKARRDGVAVDTGWRLRKNGRRFWAHITLTALHDQTGKLYGYSKVVRDLTERVEAEEQAKAYEAAREAIRVRDEFLSMAAHELRTPLTAAQLQLQGLARQLARDSANWRPERLQRGISLAIESSNRLSDLVETLLDVSRIATGKIRLSVERFDLGDAVQQTIWRLQDMIDAAGCEIALRLQPDICGSWDRLRIEQALTNLLANACKYAPRSTIEVGAARVDGTPLVRLWVRDSGPGIEPEHLERIFDRFERAVSAANYGGLGLGLYVTRQIAEVHGGSVRVDSEKGLGSTFIIELPFENQAAEASAG